MKRFPIKAEIRGSFSVPWALLAPHEEQVKTNHGGQTLEELAARGGLSSCEALCAIRGECLSGVRTMALVDGFLTATHGQRWHPTRYDVVIGRCTCGVELMELETAYMRATEGERRLAWLREEPTRLQSKIRFLGEELARGRKELEDARRELEKVRDELRAVDAGARAKAEAP